MKIVVKKKIHSNNFFDLLIILAWSNTIILSYFKAFISKLPYIYYFSDIIVLLVFVITIFFSIPHIRLHLKYYDLLFYILFAFTYLFNTMFSEQSKYLSEHLVQILFTIVPFYFLGRVINIKKQFKYIYMVSISSIIVRCLDILIFSGDSLNYIDGAMDAAYKLLPHVMITLFYALDNRTICSVVIATVGSVMILSFGSRGPVFILLCFGFIYIFIFAKFKKPVLSYSIMTVGLTIIVIFFERIVILLFSVTNLLGMSTRVYDKFISGNYFVSSGRDTIKNELLPRIIERPLLGYGIAGDRIFVETYAHNIVIEFLVSYGIVIGSIFVLWIIYMIFKTIKKTTEKNTKVFVLVLMCCGFLKLFLSSSYLLEPAFFMCIGMCVSLNKK